MDIKLLSLQETLKKFALKPQKHLGQNFLLDLNLTDKIARAAGKLEGRSVIEIGPGPGGLTRSLLKAGAERVIAIELDPRCREALEDLRILSPKLEILAANALNVDVAILGQAPRKIVANLPYNIATVLLFQWLDKIKSFESLTLMFQKEVAQRLLAVPKSSSYGRLSVLTQWLCKVERVFDIPPQAFLPPPKVISTVVHLTPHAQPLAAADTKMLSLVVKTAFGQRRKMLRSSLKSIGYDKTEAILNKAHINPMCRAEELSVVEFCQLAEAFLNHPLKNSH
ncbi:MAG: 16S rRNA (adenine(1518)-N(6)/adenine(1519)-N(6))-dimethyltransferase RsmA [Alphaproteobacteria bacterium]|nr:16S rRNA (adenine(1518)-N(6)/adenine(1519)-N(6))-dimethyltransferase RsmA [Alphaproteobacteria bacterium]